MLLTHTVKAMVGKDVKRVICNTCNGEHNYVSPTDGKKRVKAASKKKEVTPKENQGEKISAVWEKTISNMDTSNAKIYSMSGDFEENELIDHKKFGLGIISEVKLDNKIDVLFQKGNKLLVHKR